MYTKSKIPDFTLPPNPLELQIPHRNVRNQRKDKSKLIPNIAASLTDPRRHRANIPRRDHAEHPSNEPHQERTEPRNPDRQLSWIVPALEVVVPQIAFAEEVVFDEDDDEEGGIPVTQQGEEVLEDGEQGVFARQRQGQDDAEADDGPEEARDCGEGTRELLDAEGGGVHVYAVHADWECLSVYT